MFQEKVGIEMPLILRLKRVIELLEIVDMPMNQARSLCGEMSTLANTKNSCQECVVVRRPFLRAQGLENSQALFYLWRGTKDRMEMHKTVVKAIAVIRQYDYENGHPPFEVC